MNINSEGKKISEIFPIDIDVVYNIPDYQRNYAWKEDNIDTLISDIQSEEAGYYLGNIIITEG